MSRIFYEAASYHHVQTVKQAYEPAIAFDEAQSVPTSGGHHPTSFSCIRLGDSAQACPDAYTRLSKLLKRAPLAYATKSRGIFTDLSTGLASMAPSCSTN